MAFDSADLAFGPYTATYDGNPVGLVEGVWRLQSVAHISAIRGSRFGEPILDGIYRGPDHFAIALFKEWNANIRDMLWPFDTASMGQSGKIGRSAFDMSKQLILSAISGTQSAVVGPTTRTYPNVLFAPEHNMELVMGNEERNVPIVFIAFPTVVTPGDSELQHFTEVNP